MDSDIITRMLVEIATGKEPARKDTPEEAKVRRQLKIECDAIAASGGFIDVPSEIP